MEGRELWIRGSPRCCGIYRHGSGLPRKWLQVWLKLLLRAWPLPQRRSISRSYTLDIKYERKTVIMLLSWAATRLLGDDRTSFALLQSASASRKVRRTFNVDCISDHNGRSPLVLGIRSAWRSSKGPTLSDLRAYATDKIWGYASICSLIRLSDE
jgi:hypothetical protein